MKHTHFIPEKEITIITSANFPVTTYSEFFMENFPDVKDKSVLDFGAGSGILTLFAIQSGASKVVAIDIDDEAIEIIKNNLLINKITDKASVSNIKKEPISRVSDSIDIIVCNPASLPTNNDLPVFCNGGFLGTEMIIQLFNLTKILLSEEGAMYFIHTSLVPFSLIKGYMNERRLKHEHVIQKDILFRPFYSSILAHIQSLKDSYPEISYTDRDGNVYETISLLKVTK